MSHVKTLEFTRVGFIGNLDVCHAGAGGAVMTQAYERIDRVLDPFRQEFHVSVRPVHHPTANAKFFCLLTGRVTEEDSLHSSLDYYANPNVFVFIRHLHLLFDAEVVDHTFNAPTALGHLLRQVLFGAIANNACKRHDAILA